MKYVCRYVYERLFIGVLICSKCRQPSDKIWHLIVFRLIYYQSMKKKLKKIKPFSGSDHLFFVLIKMDLVHGPSLSLCRAKFFWLNTKFIIVTSVVQCSQNQIIPYEKVNLLTMLLLTEWVAFFLFLYNKKLVSTSFRQCAGNLESFWTKNWTKVTFCGNSVPTKVKTKRDQKPVQSRVHACQIEYKPMLALTGLSQIYTLCKTDLKPSNLLTT